MKKNRGHLDVAITLDGTKNKHDLQRVRKDGSGSYDEIIKNIPLWQEQFPYKQFTKVTFASEDLCYLKESVIHLWELGITYVSANVVFENVWKPGDDIIFERQLKELADYIIENKLWNKYSVRFFDPVVGYQLGEADRSTNYCGTGRMMTFDTEGNIYPCIRFLDFCLRGSSYNDFMLGNYETGICQEKLKPFDKLTIASVSDEECLNCEIASGCATCAGMNYEDSGRKTVYHRTKYICKMQKAQVRANQYFWKRYSEVTGEISPYQRGRLSKYRQYNWSLPGLKYLYFILSEEMKPHCNYVPNGTDKMPVKVFQKALAYAEEKNMIPVFLGNLSEEYEQLVGKNINFRLLTETEDYVPGELETILHIANTEEELRVQENKDDCRTKSLILLISKKNLVNMKALFQKAAKYYHFINIVKVNEGSWGDKEIMLYMDELAGIKEIAEKEKVFCNLLIESKKYQECNAGVESFTVAPNGKVYICPAFYFKNREDAICDIGEEILPLEVCRREASPICSQCSNEKCRRCVYENILTTGDICTPSANYCKVEGGEVK